MSLSLNELTLAYVGYFWWNTHRLIVSLRYLTSFRLEDKTNIKFIGIESIDLLQVRSWCWTEDRPLPEWIRIQLIITHTDLSVTPLNKTVLWAFFLHVLRYVGVSSQSGLCLWRVFQTFFLIVLRYQFESLFRHSVGCTTYWVHVSPEWCPCDLLHVLSLGTIN